MSAGGGAAIDLRISRDGKSGVGYMGHSTADGGFNSLKYS